MKMMQKHKYRVWDGEKMIYPSIEMFVSIAANGDYFELQDHRAENRKIAEVYDGCIDLQIVNNADNPKAELMRIVGLEDKKKRPLYASDVVRIPNLEKHFKHGEPDFDWRVFQIVWNRYTWALENKVLYMPLSDYDTATAQPWEIVLLGNTHENPELLNK